ncbi:MAG TPA: type III pantothenate kinase, partial [Desulfovibrio sp.]|uniref:type III pantothenate kinase n=1 Tax=Desulfovibrio sp. TaxID=885 RepID=UPI002D01F669
DFGTATTFDCIRGDALLGGLICPGLLSSARSLHMETAKLPLPTLELSSDHLRIDVGTMESLNQGLLFGAAAQVEGLAARLSEVMGGPAFVAATGGLAPSVARVCPAIQAVLPDLMFEGLAALYRRRGK